MPSTFPVPAPRTIQDALGGLVAQDVRVRVEAVDDPQRDTAGVFAEYVTDGVALAVVCFASHDLVNSSGGALLELQPAVAEESTVRSIVHDGCLEGFREIANVLSASFNSDFTPHLKLSAVHQLPGELTDELKSLWRRPQARRSYRIAVPEYGGGNLILYSN